jgi:hypothetical protein
MSGPLEGVRVLELGVLIAGLLGLGDQELAELSEAGVI